MRVYYAIEKKNPWPKTAKAAAICYECSKLVVTGVSFSYLGGKALYGPNYRCLPVNEFAGLFPGTAKSDSEVVLSIFQQFKKNKDFIATDYLIEKSIIGPIKTKGWIDEPKLAEYAAKHGIKSFTNYIASRTLESSDDE